MQLINYTQVGERARNVVVVFQFAAIALKHAFPINCIAKKIKQEQFFQRSTMNRSYEERLNAATACSEIDLSKDRPYLKTDCAVLITNSDILIGRYRKKRTGEKKKTQTGSIER